MDRDDVDNSNRSDLPRLINDDIGACGASDRQSYVCMQHEKDAGFSNEHFFPNRLLKP